MYDATDAIYLNGYQEKKEVGFYCVCGEPINYYRPDKIGYCSCGRNTESLEFQEEYYEHYADPIQEYEL